MAIERTSTCHPKRLTEFFKRDIVPIMKEDQRIKLNETPFAHLLYMPPANISACLLTKLLDAFDPDIKVFMICGEAVPFTVRDVGVALGLQTEGSVIDLRPNDKRVRLSGCYTRFHKDYFGTKNKVTLKDLREILKRLACAEGCKKSNDFVALMVLYIFSTVLFPQSNELVTTSLIPYLTKIKHLKDLWNFNWASLVHREMMELLVSAHQHSTQNIGGCTLAVLISFLERCQVDKYHIADGSWPRYHNWNLCDMSLIKEKVEKEIFDKIIKGQIRKDELPLTSYECKHLEKGCRPELVRVYPPDPVMEKIRGKGKRKRRSANEEERVEDVTDTGDQEEEEEEEEEEEDEEDVSNGNSNSAWETNGEAANANESIPPQQNSWDAWEPSTSRAGASWSRMEQHGSGFGSHICYSRRGRRGSGSK